jgi:hypothetical protein
MGFPAWNAVEHLQVQRRYDVRGIPPNIFKFFNLTIIGLIFYILFDTFELLKNKIFVILTQPLPSSRARG